MTNSFQYTDRDYLEYRSFLRQNRARIRRKREIRHHIFMVILGFLLIFLLSISYHAITSNATTKEAPIVRKCYTSIVIEYGDTLTSLADEYAGEYYDSTEDYIREVMQINHLKSSHQIIAGEHLILPYYNVED